MEMRECKGLDRNKLIARKGRACYCAEASWAEERIVLRCVVLFEDIKDDARLEVVYPRGNDCYRAQCTDAVPNAVWVDAASTNAGHSVFALRLLPFLPQDTRHKISH